MQPRIPALCRYGYVIWNHGQLSEVGERIKHPCNIKILSKILPVFAKLKFDGSGKAGWSEAVGNWKADLKRAKDLRC